MGTFEYMPPEALRGKEHNPKQADLFSSVVVLFTLISGIRPFVKASVRDPHYKLIAKNNWSEFWELYSKYTQHTSKMGQPSIFSSKFRDFFQK